MAQGPGRLLALFLASCIQAHPAWAAPAAPRYRASSCTIEGRRIELEEINFKPGNPGLELRAVLNPRANVEPKCHGNYGGPDIQALILDPKWVPGYQVVGAVNGTVFRALERTYISNQMIWSAGGGQLARLRKSGGNHLFVVDTRGGRDVALKFVTCTPSNLACAEIQLPGQPPVKRALVGKEIVRELQKRYPTMSLVLQSNMPLMDSQKDRHGRFIHWSACPPKKPNDWRCTSAARTVVCAKRDGSLSLITTPAAYPIELAQGLRRGGSCHVDCEVFYNLDGGGSTQMAHLLPGKSTGFEFSGRRVETTQPECSPYRPVDNYLVVVRPR
jgi:hypothetical protein